MRHCHSESPDVYQSEGEDVSELFFKAAKFLATVEDDSSWVNATLSTSEESGYILTVYIH